MKEDPFIEKHLNRIKIISALYGSKKLFVECYPTDEGALCFPNSNRAVKEIFIEDVPDSKSPESENAALRSRIKFLENLISEYTGKMLADLSRVK